VGISYKCLVAAAALAFVGAAPAIADGYARPGPMVAPVAYTQPAGWYLRGDLTYEWRGSTDVEGNGPNTDSTRFSLKSSLLLANLYYDFRPNERFTPYVGIGVGAARHSASGGTILPACSPCANYVEESSWSAVGALMAGLSYRIDRGHRAPVSVKDGYAVADEPGRLHIDLGYRFLYLGDAHTGNLQNTIYVTPGPRLEDITAHELRVGLRWDIR
jgi:opacity protein-like surface antigen